MAVAYARRRRTRAQYGDGSMRQMRSGRWRVQVSAGTDRNTGKRLRGGGYAPTREEAVTLKARLLDELARGITRARTKAIGALTLATWFDQWLADLEGGNSRTQDHRDDWGFYIKAHLGHVKLRELTSADVRRLVNSVLLGTPGRSGKLLSPTSRHHVWSVLHRVLEAACEDDGIRLERNVAKGVKVLGYRYDGYKARILDDEEYEALLTAALDEEVETVRERRARGLETVPMAAGLILLAETGLRYGELAGATERAVDLDRATLRVQQQAQRIRGRAAGTSRKRDGSRIEIVRPKSQRGLRTADLTPRCLAALHLHFEALRALQRRMASGWNARGLLMPTITGLPTSNRAFTDFFRRACVRAGIVYSDEAHRDGLKVHDLRHTFAVRRLRQHGDIYRLQRELGHSSIKMTERYLQFVSEDEVARARTRE